MKPHTRKPLVLCESKEDLLVIQTLADHAGLEAKDRMSLEYAIPNLPIDWEDSAFVPLKELLAAIAFRNEP